MKNRRGKASASDREIGPRSEQAPCLAFPLGRGACSGRRQTKKASNSMNVRELIEALSKMPPKLEVHTAYHYGDRLNRLVTPAVYEGPEVCLVKHSDYVDDDVMAEEGDENVTEVVVIR